MTTEHDDPSDRRLERWIARRCQNCVSEVEAVDAERDIANLVHQIVASSLSQIDSPLCS